MNSEVKQLEEKVNALNQKKPCDVWFFTYAGAVTLTVADIAEIDLKELKALLRSLASVAKKVKGKDKYSELVDTYVSSLIYIGNIIRQAKEEGQNWYIECLTDIVKTKEAEKAIAQ